jgi:hypothetical protein
MIRISLIVVAFLLPLPLTITGSTCPEPQSAAEFLQFLEKKGRPPSTMSESCFCTLLQQNNDDDATALVTAYCRRFPVHDTLLFCVFRQPSLRNNRKLFTTVLRGWKKTNPSLPAVLAALQRSGTSDHMDTLLRIFDREDELEVQQLLQWVEVKKVLDDFGPVPDLFCKVIAKRPELLPRALRQFEILLDDLPGPLADSILQQFTRCTSSDRLVQAGLLRRWAIGQYGRKHLYNRQISAVSALKKNSTEQCSLFLSIARDCYEQRRYIPAATAGRTLYTHACDNSLRREAASLLVAVYRGMDRPDSAAVWLEQTGAPTEKNRREAVALYLTLGNLTRAAELLSLLPPSLERDTLQLQYLLLSDSLHAARRFAFDETAPLARAPYPRLEWRFRTSLFDGSTDTCLILLDSLTAVAPQSEITGIQEYRYWLLRLSDTPAALAKFIKIEYTLYKGEYELAVRQLCDSDRDPVNDWRIGVHVARRQLDRSEAAAAVATLRCAPEPGEPEYLYCLADALFRDREYNGARELLQHLVLDYPADQYTTRARLLLARIP